MSDQHPNDPTDPVEGDLAGFFAEDDASIDDGDVEIGARITEARKVMGDSVEVIAERVGVEADTFAAWESGELQMRPNHLNRVAGVLGISLSWLIMGRGAEPMSSPSELNQVRVDLADARSRLDDVLNELAVIDQRLADIDNDKG